MKVHVVTINLQDCEPVTLAGHDKCWLKGDIDKHFASISDGQDTLDSYVPSKRDEFIVTELELANTKEEVEHRLLTIDELRALLADDQT